MLINAVKCDGAGNGKPCPKGSIHMGHEGADALDTWHEAHALGWMSGPFGAHRCPFCVSQCAHTNTKEGPDIPLRHGSWSSEVCTDCKAWRPMAHSPRRPLGEWHSDDINAHTTRDENA